MIRTPEVSLAQLLHDAYRDAVHEHDAVPDMPTWDEVPQDERSPTWGRMADLVRDRLVQVIWEEPPGWREMCQRTEDARCAAFGPHLAGLHLNPDHELWDGPDATVKALNDAQRRAAWLLLGLARAEGVNHTEQPWREVRPPTGREIEGAVYRLAEHIHRQSDQIAAVRVDMDRQVTRALRLSESCEHHSAEIRQLADQVAHFDNDNQRIEAERCAYVGEHFDLRQAFADSDTDVAKAIMKRLRATERAIDRIRARYDRRRAKAQKAS